MRQMLHHAMSVKKPETKTVGGSYSADDLQAIGSMMKATGELRNTYNESDRNLFEAQFAAYAIKTETVFSSLDVNADLRDKLGSISQQAVSDTVDNANAILEQYRNEPYVNGEKEYRYRAYDKAAILDMLNRVTEGIQARRPLRDVLSAFDGLLQSLYQERTLGLHGSDSSFAQSVNTFAVSLGTSEVPLQSSYLDVAY
jgi:predicted DNA-binding protein YlxM (UPF0122 family)